MSKISIIGSGIAGLSCSYHAGHENCILFEKNKYFGGHLYSHKVDGFVWDEGPHISFTKHDYVRDLFEKSTKGDYFEFESNVANFFQGNWIPHPAQSNLYAIPEELKNQCVKDFLDARKKIKPNYKIKNYQ